MQLAALVNYISSTSCKISFTVALSVSAVVWCSAPTVIAHADEEKTLEDGKNIEDRLLGLSLDEVRNFIDTKTTLYCRYEQDVTTCISATDKNQIYNFIFSKKLPKRTVVVSAHKFCLTNDLSRKDMANYYIHHFQLDAGEKLADYTTPNVVIFSGNRRDLAIRVLTAGPCQDGNHRGSSYTIFLTDKTTVEDTNNHPPEIGDKVH
jgi:hypothetical protein